STATISMGIVFEPVGASILAYFILGETITWSQWLGGSIVLFGLFLFIMSTTKKRKVTISHRNCFKMINIKRKNAPDESCLAFLRLNFEVFINLCRLCFSQS